ncbi:upper zone of growth plate and cartilage matrix-associated protein isoform X2 [Paroedura picta]|uniref:upper zone of growth plate and cartilage matrix-associated protein isoform X2 n=1 Tax=Paroedura picta TaxID=143630 RepID=UPI004057A1A3
MPLFTSHAKFLEGGTTVAVSSQKAATGESSKESLKKRVFMKESDASNFFKKRGKRATKSRDELNAETRQMLAADEQRREYYEEQRNEFENFVEEERDEQDERSREQIEQWREYHYDGLYPPYLYNRHIV